MSTAYSLKPETELGLETNLPETPSNAANKPSRRFARLLTLAELSADMMTAVAVIVFSYAPLSRLFGTNDYSRTHLLAPAVGIGFLLALFLNVDGAYRVGNSLLRVRETERVIRACVRCFFVVLCVDFMVAEVVTLRLSAILALLVMAGIVLVKQLLYAGVRKLHAEGFAVRNVVIYGAGYTGRRVFNAISRSPKLGLAPTAIIDDDESKTGGRVYERSYTRKRSIPILTGPVSQDLLQSLGAEVVIAAIPSLGRERFLQVQNATLGVGAQFAFVPNSHVPSDLWMEHTEVDGLMVATLGLRSESIVYRSTKRLLDLVVSVLLLILVAPLLALIAALIRLDSSGPAIFVQERVGHNGKRFKLLKFRTMFVDAPKYFYSPLESSDARITRVGRFLRRTSLDELPQLMNILRGEMSLVGPRPEMPFIVQQYLPQHLQRLRVKPGLTGLWQISADRAFLIHENIDYDLYYIRNRNFFMDVAILFHTFIFAVRGV
jgi:exopolysaccharide biosynthesis polyprenyl glycosylphosphotransferase